MGEEACMDGASPESIPQGLCRARGPGGAAPARRRRSLAWRKAARRARSLDWGMLRSLRSRVLAGGLLLLAVGARLGLPYALRPLLVERADRALQGRVELADLDLSLLRGGVTLHGVAVYAAERPAPGAPEPPPVFEARRLWTQIGWLALLSRTLEVEELELDGFQVRLVREAAGLVLPR